MDLEPRQAEGTERGVGGLRGEACVSDEVPSGNKGDNRRRGTCPAAKNSSGATRSTHNGVPAVAVVRSPVPRAYRAFHGSAASAFHGSAASVATNVRAVRQFSVCRMAVMDGSEGVTGSESKCMPPVVNER